MVASEDGRGLAAGDQASDGVARASLMRTAVRWLTVCSLSAIPSFFFGLAITNGQIAAMMIGILIFAIGYTVLDYQTADWRFRQDRRTRRTLKIVYGTRIAISILLPIGAYVDIYCGLLAVGLTESVTGDGLTTYRSGGEMSFVAALMTTLFQGLLLNLVLGVYAILVHVTQITVAALRQ